jgi:phosphoglycerate dehydrogenase-like enzyme
MKAVLHFNAGALLRSELSSWHDPAITFVDETDGETFLREIADAEVLLHVLQPVTAAMIAAAPKLRLIQKIGVGINTIDLGAAKKAGIAVANMPGTNTIAVAEYTIALMLATLRRIVNNHLATIAGSGWSQSQNEMELNGELCGRSIGLVGFGAVPRRMATILHAFGAEVLFSNRSAHASPVARQLPLTELLAKSDIVSLHIPATPQTRHMFDRDALQRMKRGAILINTARGEIVDEAALGELLRSGHLAGAGLDVFENEPLHDLTMFRDHQSVTLSPHVAWLTNETIARSLVVVRENCRRLRDGEPLSHRII